MSATSIGYESRAKVATNGGPHTNGVSRNGVSAAGASHNGNGKLLQRAPEVGTGRLDVLVPHLIRSQFLRPGFVRLSLWLGIARQMPMWAKSQFLNHGVSREDLEWVLGRISGLDSWADTWEKLGAKHEQAGRDAESRGDFRAAGAAYLAASAAFNFAQYVIFLDVRRKRTLHEACVRAYQAGAPYFDPPVTRFEVMFRRKTMVGSLRVPRNAKGPVPVVVLFNGTNAVKEELHWWSDEFVKRGIACVMFDGPGMGQTFHRLSMVGEPRSMGIAIMNHIEAHPELDAGAVAFMGQSLGGHCAIRMAAYDGRIKAVAAVSPPFSVDVYWKVTLAGMRRELAALYGLQEQEMAKVVHRITLAGDLPSLQCPMLVAGGGQDHITPHTEAWRIFETARCERDIVFYPKGGHDCFNMMTDLRPRVVSWIERQLEPHRGRTPLRRSWVGAYDPSWSAGEAVDSDFAADLAGEAPKREWHEATEAGVPVRWEWPWVKRGRERLQVVCKSLPCEHDRSPWISPA